MKIINVSKSEQGNILLHLDTPKNYLFGTYIWLSSDCKTIYRTIEDNTQAASDLEDLLAVLEDIEIPILPNEIINYINSLG